MSNVEKTLLDKAREQRWIYCDIDGTLTDSPGEPWGKPRLDLIWKLKDAILDGWRVVLWSACGKSYCQEFAKEYNISGLEACLAKPSIAVDDNPDLRSARFFRKLSPEQFLKEEL